MAGRPGGPTNGRPVWPGGPVGNYGLMTILRNVVHQNNCYLIRGGLPVILQYFIDINIFGVGVCTYTYNRARLFLILWPKNPVLRSMGNG